MSGPRPQQGKEFVQSVILPGREPLGVFGNRQRPPALSVLKQLFGQCLDRENEIGQAGIDGASWHPFVFRVLRDLHQHDSPLIFHGSEPDRPVRASSGEDQGYRILFVGLRERTEEEIDWSALPARLLECRNRQLPIGGGERPVGWNDEDVIRLDLGLVGHLDDRHGSVPLQDLGEAAFPVGVEMNDDDEGESASIGQGFEKAF